VNPVTGTPQPPAFPATFAAAGSPYSGAPFADAARRPAQTTFGMAAAAKAGAETAQKLGKLAMLRAMGHYYVKGANKEAIKALFWQYGVPLLFGLSFLVPVVGWAVGLTGLAAIPLAIRKGKKIRAQLDLAGAKGPFARISDITHEYEKATNYKEVKTVEKARSFAGGITAKLRDFVDELFPDQDNKQIKNLQKAVNGLKPTAGGRVERLIGGSLEVQFSYQNRWQGKLLRSLNKGIASKTLLRLPFLRLPMLAFRMLLVGGLMFINRGALRQGLKAVV